MAKLPFNPGTPEMHESLEWHKVDQSHLWRLVEHLAAYIEQDPNCPSPLKSWIRDAHQYSLHERAPENKADAFLGGLGLKLKGKPPKAPGPITVHSYYQGELRRFELLFSDNPKSLAITRTAVHFDIGESTVYARLKEYVTIMEEYEKICREEF